MNITPETKKIHDIFSIQSNELYTIPDFQRGYCWDEEIDKLFDDIKNYDSDDSGWYIGSLLISKDNSTNTNLVIDGQQRLTTISLLFLAIYSELSNLRSSEEISQKLKDEICETRSDIKRQLQKDTKDGKQLILNHLSNDASQFKYLCENIFDEKVLSLAKNKKIYNGYKKSIDLINSLFDEYSNDTEKAENILKFFKDRLAQVEILRIQVMNIPDAYQVFLTLNARGKALAPSDIIKAIYLGKNNGGKEYADKKWSEFADIFLRNDNMDAKLMEKFLLCNHDAFINNTFALTSKKLIEVYEKELSNADTPDKLNNFFSELINKAKLYVTICNGEYSEFESIEKLTHLDSSQAHSLILYMLHKCEESNKEQIKKILDFLVNFFVRRNIVLTPKSSNIHGCSQRVIGDFKKHGISAQIAINKFKELNGFPNDKRLEVALDEGIYNKNKNTCRYVLVDFERKYGNYFANKGIDENLDGLTNKGKPQWSIEHIHPQSAIGTDKNDNLETVKDNNDIVIWDNIDDDLGNCFGNLTLTAHNCELGNKSFSEKLEYRQNPENENAPFEEHTGLKRKFFLNCIFVDDGTCPDNWGEQEIKERNEWFKKLVLQRYKID